VVRRFCCLLVLVASLAPVRGEPQTATPETPCPACLTYYHNTAGKTNLIDEISLDRDEAERTILLNTSKHAQLYLVIFYTYSTATHVLVKLSCSNDDTNFVARPVEMLETEGRNQRFLLSYDVTGCSSTKVLLGGSSDANSADIVSVQAVGQTSVGSGEAPRTPVQ